MGIYNKMTNLEGELDDALAQAANRVVNAVKPLETKPKPPIKANNIDQLIADEGGPGALEAVKGALFESITNAVIGGAMNDSRGRLDIAFNDENRPPLEAIFGINKKYNFSEARDYYGIAQVYDYFIAEQRKLLEEILAIYESNELVYGMYTENVIKMKLKELGQ